MRHVTGVLGAVQEGRFRLDCDDGRSRLFVLHRHAAIEAQDLVAIATRPLRITVGYHDVDSSRGAVARELTPAGLVG